MKKEDIPEVESCVSNRRDFLKAGAAAGAAATLTPAASYARIIGANDRIRTGHIGIGNRGTSLL